jgi:phospholipid N-methyltransferase
MLHKIGFAGLESFAVEYLLEFLSKPTRIGAIVPSSRFLAQTILQGADLHKADTVLEYGPGTGVFTELILRELKPGAKFAAIELSPRFAEIFKARYPRVKLFQDSVANVGRICRRAGMESVDCIVSGVPWAVFPESVQVQCLNEMMRVLKPDGQFVTFTYVHSRALAGAKRFFGSLLPSYFEAVSKSPVVWLNIPPAFVYRCRRPSAQLHAAQVEVKP